MDKIAVIDIGSNALRLAIGRRGQVEESFYHRFPLRLGSETFVKGTIGPLALNKLIKALDYFLKIIDQNEISEIKAYATSAIRDARNMKTVIKKIYDVLDLKIEIIDGKTEANLIFKAIDSYYTKPYTKEALIMDIGGGSVELIANKNKRLSAISYKMGTVRLLAKHKSNINIWQKWIQSQLKQSRRLISTSKAEGLFFVGTGGNVRRMGKLSQALKISKKSQSLSFDSLLALTTVLQELSPRQRQLQLGLKHDRADVILPAAIITLNIMELYKIGRIHIPNIGLKNGLMLK